MSIDTATAVTLAITEAPTRGFVHVRQEAGTLLEHGTGEQWAVLSEHFAGGLDMYLRAPDGKQYLLHITDALGEAIEAIRETAS